MPSRRIQNNGLDVLIFRILATVFAFLIICSLISPAASQQPNLGPSTQAEAYFNGSAYIRLHTTISLRKHTGLSFRTCQGGVLFSQKQNGDQIELSVTLEGVSFQAKTSGKILKEKIPGNFIDNKWHTVYLIYVLGNLTLNLDGQSVLLANGTYRNYLLSSSNYNEGSAVLIVGNNFNGCLLEGPSLVFNSSIIQSNHNVVFENCPISYLDCSVTEPNVQPNYCIIEPCMRHGSCINGLTAYSCVCLPRYSGKNCEIDQGDPCTKKPNICKNQGLCTSDSTGLYLCNCPAGYTGKHCEIKIVAHSICEANPCKNGGTCDVGSDERLLCVCPAGFTGHLCEQNIDECTKTACLNGGSCIDGLNNFTCDCSHTGYQGHICDVNVNECLGEPCLNHGICFDTYGSYLCQCLAGFGGHNCQIKMNECDSQPCQNRGICISHDGTYDCRCPQGFTGEYCQHELNPPECEQEQCPNYADCVVISNQVTCICKKEFGGDFPNCNLNAMCTTNPCQNNGICTSMNGYLNCSCPPGFTGRYCQVNIDECASKPCLNEGNCTDLVNGFQCNCTENWMGLVCEQPYDACELKLCQNNASCTTNPENKHEFACKCPTGFVGKRCETNIDDCAGNKCPSPRMCVDLVNDFDCRCPAGYTGDNCSVDLDPCSKTPCGNGACQFDNVTLEYNCVCPAGYTGSSCLDDINECSMEKETICNHGICVNNMGSFQCYCQPGYTGERCNLDFNECLSMPCWNNATCLNKINNYECLCPAGYNGKNCDVDINECEPQPCAEGATCQDGINEFTCHCQPGLSGRLCDVNINDCSPNPCQNNAECIDGLNNYTCNCNDTGYEGDHCEINIDDCKDKPCQNGAECDDQIKDYSCKCYPGYTGKNCELDINECDSSPCKYGGTCLEKSNLTLYQNANLEAFNRPFSYDSAEGYACLCVPGVTGQNCETNINECESSPCFQGSCVDQIDGYSCECNEGFEGVHCDVDINECEIYRPCLHGTCHDRKASYFCSCDSNFGGKNCSVELVGCNDSPCKNEGQCVPYLINETDHKFNCSCSYGFHGSTCEMVTTMSLSGQSLITVNTTRDEGYDVQFRFKTTLPDGVLAVGKGVTYYILELSQGRLNLHSSLLNKWEGVFIGSNLNDSKWQKVFVAINSSHLVLSANDEQTIYPITFNENFNVSSTSFPLTYIGGYPSNLRKLTQGHPFLVGCTEDVIINAEWVLPEDHNANWVNFYDVGPMCVREPQCSPNPCHSGGHCTDRWMNFSCTCERPYLGHTCQYNYTAATFGYENITDSLVTVNVSDFARRAVRTIVDISMFIRTRQSKGQIFYLGSPYGSTNLEETYIAAQLEGGELLVRIQFNGSLEAYTVGGVKLNNGYNHLIEVIRNVTLVQVKLNGTEYFRKTISAPGTLDAQILYLGGQPQLRSVRQASDSLITKVDITPPTAPAAITSLNSVNFKGIIQDVQVSNGSTVMIVEFYELQADDVEIPLKFGDVTFDSNSVLEGIHSDDLCRINPCQHSGVCQNTWNDYKCNCIRGFKGKNCTELEFCELEDCPVGSVCRNLEAGYECIANSTFNGKENPLKYQLIVHSNSTKDLKFDTIQLTYRTRSWGTILFVLYQQNYFTIFIYHNEVVIEWRFGDGEIRSQRFRKDKFEAQWVTLHFTYKDSILRGGFYENVADDAPNFEVEDFDHEAFLELIQNGSVFVGGSDNKTFNYRRVIESTDENMTGYIPVSETTTHSSVGLISNSLETTDYEGDVFLYKVDQNKNSDNFKGCLQEIRLGGLLLPFYEMETLYPNSGHPDEYFKLLPHSKIEIDCILCYENDCYNEGHCISPRDTYKCNCSLGYTADDCSIDINECDNNQCNNNATCKDLIGRYECECKAGFEGEHCEEETNECLSNPCRHGGTCIDLIGSFKCDCPENFVGKQCEAPLLITCDNKPCKVGATCETGANEMTGNNFTCFCTEGMEGPLCDTAFCLRKHCEQGFCNTSSAIPYCHCERGFEGEFCEINIDECVSPIGQSPCQNGGVCRDGIFRYDCDCSNTGFTGVLCEIDIDECNTTQNQNPCGFDGKCENLPGSYRCLCETPGKCGHHCALNDLCFTEKPCQHGGCTSLCTEVSAYKCVCDLGYTGKNCSELEVAASRDDGGVNILYIVVPVVLAFLIGLAIGMAVLVNIARSKRATRGTYSPSAQEFCNPRVELDHVLKPPPEERLI